VLPSRDRESVAQQSLTVLSRFGLLLLLIVLVAYFSVERPDSFVSFANASSILSAQSVTVIAGLGILLTLTLGEFDLSVAANLSLASVFVVTLPERQGVPVWLSIIIAVAISAGVGLINGLVVVRLQVNAFVGTLGMATLLGGMAQLYLGGTDQYVAPTSLTALARTEWLRLPLSVFYALAIAMVLHVVLRYTAVGRRMNAVGGNVRAARLTGIPADRYRIAAFTAGGLLAGVAGVVLGATLGAATAAGNPALLLPIFAAALLGSTTISPGRFNVPGLLVAVLFLAVVVSGLQQMGVAAWIQPAFNGTALVVAVALAGWASRARVAHARRRQLEAIAAEGAATATRT
jgi:ribose transport system permease protein